MTDQQIRERCVRHLHVFQAQIDMHGWSDDLCVNILESLCREMLAAGLERAAYLTENDVSLDIKFREKCATAIRREIQRVKEVKP